MTFLAQVNAFEDLNIKNKDTAIWEILIMLCVAFLLGFIVHWLICRNDHTEDIAPVRADKPARKKVAAVTSVKEDLTVVEGIGPKINELLHDAGIRSYADLSGASITKLRNILEDAGSRYRVHDPSSWSKQAKLAAAGKFTELEALKDSLNKGR